MKLLIVLITYNRLAYTKKTLKCLQDSISDQTPYYLVVVDNNSTDGTKEYLKSCERRHRIDKLILNPENYYPGKACNIGWSEGMKAFPGATHLMRLDNDMWLAKDWDLRAAEFFEKIPDFGQLGLDYSAVAGPEAQGKKLTLNGMTINHWPGCVGGPNIISRAVWDKGIIYDETPWQVAGNGGPSLQEDSKFSQEIMWRGFVMGHWTEDYGHTFADETNWKDYPEYYKKTFTERGYDKLLEKL